MALRRIPLSPQTIAICRAPQSPAWSEGDRLEAGRELVAALGSWRPEWSGRLRPDIAKGRRGAWATRQLERLAAWLITGDEHPLMHPWMLSGGPKR